MSKDLDYIGLIERESIYKTVAVDPWQPMAFDLPPYDVVKPSPGYMLTLGSGNVSMATIAYGFQYVSGIDVFRHDFNSPNATEPLINVDHYIAGSVDASRSAVFKTPPQEYHWLKPTDKVITYMPPEWQACLRSMLHRGSK